MDPVTPPEPRPLVRKVILTQGGLTPDEVTDRILAIFATPAAEAGPEPGLDETTQDGEPLTPASVALLNKIAPHAVDGADELRRRAATNRRLALADELRIIERTVRADFDALREPRS